MSNRHELGNMIFNLEERKNLKEVKFTKSAIKEVLSYLKELYEIKNKEHEEDRRVADLETKLAQAKMNERFEKEKKENAFKLIEELKQQLAESEKESNARYESWQEEIRECDRLRVVLTEVRKQLAEKDESHHKNIVELTKMVTEKDRKIEELKGERLKFYTDDVRRTQVINGVHFDIEQMLVFSEYVEHEKWIISNRDKEIEELNKQLLYKDKEISVLKSQLCLSTISQSIDQDKISFAVEQLEKVKYIINKSGYTILEPGWVNLCVIDNQIKQLKEMK